MRRATIILALLAATAFVLAACGGGNGNGNSGDGERLTKAEYESELSALGSLVSEGFEALGDPGSPEELEMQIEQAQTDLRDLADQLEGVNPPEEIEAAHDKLIESIRMFSDDLTDISSTLLEAAESEDPAAAFEVLGELVNLESVAMLQDVAETYQEQGYVTGLEDTE